MWSSAIAGFVSLVTTLFNGMVKYPWRTSTILLIGYVVWCQMTHYGPLTIAGKCPQVETGDTLSDTITETAIFDSSIVETNDFDTIPISEEPPADPTAWERPEITLDTGATCADSVTELMSSIGWYELSLKECEDRVNYLETIRTYSDSTRNDTMVTGYTFQVRGELFGKPTTWYKRVAPYITKTRTVTVVEVRGPYRKIGIGGQAGPHFWNTNKFRGVETSIALGYMSLKNDEINLEGGYLFQQDPGWKIMVGYKKWFDLSKK